MSIATKYRRLQIAKLRRKAAKIDHIVIHQDTKPLTLRSLEEKEPDTGQHVLVLWPDRSVRLMLWPGGITAPLHWIGVDELYQSTRIIQE